jgi:hypothetical protein
MTQTKIKTQFVICVRTEGNDDLVPGKVYQLLADEKAAQVDYLRVIDESGEDYLYPASYFVSIVLPQAAERVLFAPIT